jgi:hypothetical protein
MDTILFILFYNKEDAMISKIFLENLPANKWQDPFYKEIYETMCMFFHSIHGENANLITSEKLRKVLWKYKNHPKVKNGFETFHDTEQHDAIEFLEFLFNLFYFRIPPYMYSTLTIQNRFAIQCHHTTLRWLWLPWKIQTQSPSYIYHCSYMEFVNGKDSIQAMILQGIKSIDDDIRVQRYICGIGNVMFNKQERWEQITELGKFFIFVVHREDPVSLYVNRKKMEISLKIRSKGRTLHLCSVVMHHGRSIHSGHYTCLQRSGNLWFHYNDMEMNMERQLHRWEKMNEEYRPCENGIAFFYHE